jgi:hypothetical protein
MGLMDPDDWLGAGGYIVRVEKLLEGVEVAG